MKVALGILAVVVLLLGSVVWVDHQELAELGASQAKASQQGDNLAQTEKCAAQAEKVFRGYGYNSSGSDDFQSHFNRKLNKCFVAIETTIQTSHMRMLLDAYERRGYGEFDTMLSNDATGLPKPIVMNCVVNPNSSGEKRCGTEEQYNKLIAEYWSE